jgi:catalase
LGGALKTDKSKLRGLAIKLNGENEAWTMVMLNTEINFAKNPQEFGQFFEMNIPVNRKVDKENVAKLMKEVDSYRNFIEYNSKRGITPSVSNI